MPMPFAMFDCAPVRPSLALAGVIFLSLAHRLQPPHRQAALEDGVYVTEARTPEAWDRDRLALVRLRDAARTEVRIAALIHQGRRRINPPGDMVVRSGDTLLTEGDGRRLMHSCPGRVWS